MNVCMLAYAHYLNDARIKSYVRTLEDQGHRVDIIALRSDGEASVERREAGSIFRIMDKYQGRRSLMYVVSYLAFIVKAAFFLTRRSISGRYDVIHVHNMPNALVFAAAIPKMYGARLILDVHDLMTANYMVKFGINEKSLVIRGLKLEQWVSAAIVDRVLCADDNQKEYLIEECGIAESKITVLLNLPNVNLFKAVNAERKSDSFRVVYHGTIAHRLGIDLILMAAAKAASRVPLELWVYGAGDYLEEAIELAKRLEIDHAVHFSRSFFPVERIPEIVSGMDVGIIGNRRNLACDKFMLPVKLLEYVYLGVPVIAPRLQVIARYFDESMLRFYEPENVEQLADSLVELFHDKPQRERLSSAALGFYRKNNIQAQAERYLELVKPAA